MNNLIRFKLKMLIVLTFCVFMTFSMLIYVMKLTEKCEDSTDETCFQISRNSGYVLYSGQQENGTSTNGQLSRPSSFTPGGTVGWKKSTTTTSRTKRSTNEIVKLSSSPSSTSYSSPSSGKDVSSKGWSEGSSSVYGKVESSSPMSSVASVEDKSRFKRVTRRDFDLEYNLVDVFKRKFNVSGYDSRVQVFIDRQKNLLRLCPKFHTLSQILKKKKLKLNHILIDEKHKVLYCYVPKVACTNWKRIFLVLTGQASNISEVINLPSNEIHAKNLFKSLQNYSTSEVETILEDYTKFIFVRHPFERLLSAYRNKLEQHYDSSKYFQARFGKYIIKKFRKNPSNVSLEKGDDVTFAEFASYLVSSDPNSYNEHWQRVTDLCHPCLINYDFVGKYESLIEDSNFLLKYLRLNFSFPLLPKPSTTAFNLNKYYNTLGKSILYKLYSIYEMDFRLFGYHLFNITDRSTDL